MASTLGEHPLRIARFRQWLLLVFSIATPVVAVEIFLQLTDRFRPVPRLAYGEYPNRPSENFLVDNQTGWRMYPGHSFDWEYDGIPSTYRANAQGFRGDWKFEPQDTRTRIVLVGDSFTFGTGVQYDETFGAHIDAALSEAVVYNLGMPGFGVDQMWMSVRHQALALDPDLIIVSFIDNDFDRGLTGFRPGEGLNKPTFVLHEGRLVPQTKQHLPNPFVSALEHHSRLWTALRIVSHDLSRDVAFGGWLRLNQEILASIQQESRAAGVPVLFVRMLIKHHQVPFPTLREFMDEIDAAYIDFAELLASQPPDIYFLTDFHINAQGHRYAADVLLRWINSEIPSEESWNLSAPAHGRQ